MSTVPFTPRPQCYIEQSSIIPTIVRHRSIRQRQPVRRDSPLISIDTGQLEMLEPRQVFMPTVLTANIRRRFVRKTDEPATVPQHNWVDVAGLTESWLKEGVPMEVVSVSRYTMHRYSRKDGRRGGGMTVLVRQGVPCRRMTELETADVESVWLLYRKSHMPHSVSHVVIGLTCHPPSADNKATTSYLLDCLDTVSQDHPHAGIVLLVDFNRLQDTALFSYPLKQVVKAPMHGTAVLDKIYTNLQD
jgi:hypothetical protein